MNGAILNVSRNTIKYFAAVKSLEYSFELFCMNVDINLQSQLDEEPGFR